MLRGPTGTASSSGRGLVGLVTSVEDELGDGVGGDHRRGNDEPKDDHTPEVDLGVGQGEVTPDKQDQHDDDRHCGRCKPCTSNGDTRTGGHGIALDDDTICRCGFLHLCHGTFQSSQRAGPLNYTTLLYKNQYINLLQKNAERSIVKVLGHVRRGTTGKTISIVSIARYIYCRTNARSKMQKNQSKMFEKTLVQTIAK